MIEFVELLEAGDELILGELIEGLQNCLIIEKKEWLQYNLTYFCNISKKHEPFNLLRDHLIGLLYEEPQLFLISHDFKKIEKSVLMFILENDNLKLEEIDIWDYVIQWGISQDQELEFWDISLWNNNHFTKLKNT